MKTTNDTSIVTLSINALAHPTLYTDFVAGLAKPGQKILESLTSEKCDLWHMVSCVPGEAGELFDAVKKFVIYEKELDRENVIEELGDLEFYLQGIRNNLGITREECLDNNGRKLQKRYGEKVLYSNEAAQNRVDKVELVKITHTDSVEELDDTNNSRGECD